MADALASGASPGNRVEVRVLSSAPIKRPVFGPLIMRRKSDSATRPLRFALGLEGSSPLSRPHEGLFTEKHCHDRQAFEWFFCCRLDSGKDVGFKTSARSTPFRKVMTGANAYGLVILPAFNAASFVGLTIDSILGQTRPPDRDHHRQRWFDQRDSARSFISIANPRINSTKTQWQQFQHAEHHPRTRNQQSSTYLDADDLWRPTMLEKQLAVLNPIPH